MPKNIFILCLFTSPGVPRLGRRCDFSPFFVSPLRARRADPLPRPRKRLGLQPRKHQVADASPSSAANTCPIRLNSHRGTGNADAGGASGDLSAVEAPKKAADSSCCADTCIVASSVVVTSDSLLGNRWGTSAIAVGPSIGGVQPCRCGAAAMGVAMSACTRRGRVRHDRPGCCRGVQRQHLLNHRLELVEARRIADRLLPAAQCRRSTSPRRVPDRASRSGACPAPPR